uniref:DH domain-containing protein n=1 Tax=Psilocybe cubensis TaxID=181762 RepID=A0A8H7Y5A4_PSICU
MLLSVRSFFSLTKQPHTSTAGALKQRAHSNPTDEVDPPPEVKVTKPDLEQFKPQSCHCGHQQPEFCPYCEYDLSIQVERAISLVNGTRPDIGEPTNYAQMDGADGPPRRRKLRKTKSVYSRLDFAKLDNKTSIAMRPNSMVSNNSRTPLLDDEQPSKSYYPTLPSERKTPNKLEKRGRPRTGSLPTMRHSTLSDISNNFTPQRPIKTVKSKSFLNSRAIRSFGPRPNPISKSIETDALVALAWTGQALSTSSPFPTPGSNSSYSPCSGSSSFLLSATSSISENQLYPSTNLLSPGLTDDKRRSVLRKPKDPNDAKLAPRPWTLAMVITDDGVTDERLVKDLEQMRIKDPSIDTSIIPDRYPFPERFFADYQTQLYDSLAEYPLQSGEAIPDPISPSDASWTSARQALLLCRELVRTERRYVSSLKVLITNGTSTPPPSQMLPYLPSLISASESLLVLMEENPSVQGVSQAFLACNNQLAEAFINWCGIVGQFFDSDDGVKNKGNLEDTADIHKNFVQPPISPRRVLSVESVLPIVVTEPNKIRKNTKARPSVRDLAILPTQRIMRYVLLFKELRALTPASYTSSSFVQLAVQAAESIAQSADEAQRHTSFVQPTNQ